MNKQLAKAELLKSLHIKGDPLILFNIWDVGSALAIQEAGAKAISTSSWSVSASHGFEDSEKLPFELVIANLKRIIKSTDLPVTIDLETGYGANPIEVKKSIKQAIEAGAVGINIEDQRIGSELLYSIKEQCLRISAAKETAIDLKIPIFINARTDVFFKNPTELHNEELLENSLSRAIAYAKCGADGLFVPGLINPEFIERLCIRSPIPVNVMMSPSMPSPKVLSKLGVARISYGPYPYIHAIESLKVAGKDAYAMLN